MHQRLLLTATTLLLLLAILAGSGLLLVEAHPLTPGQAGYATQEALEQARLKLTPGPAARARLALTLAGEHLTALQQLAGGEREALALASFDSALDCALYLLAALPPEALPTARAGLFALAERALQTVANLPRGEAVERAQAKLTEVRRGAGLPASAGDDFLALAALSLTPPLLARAGDPGAAPAAPAPLGPRAVPFPAESLASHDIFPLEGAHAGIECAACHPGDVYRGTARACQSCHENTHAGRFGALENNCTTCHNTADFLQVSFDHLAAGVTDCQPCHRPDTPQDHYAGQCSNCHLSTTDWKTILMDHTGLANCQRCHAAGAPANHYAGQCSNCHLSTDDWKLIQMDHTGLNDCGACHVKDRP
ncbi:MAG: cytochrome c3 family protein, partial [Chloroflexi bacterium]|nr:cytochrome c3 family protein [Chloroflexota bacterium]